MYYVLCVNLHVTRGTMPHTFPLNKGTGTMCQAFKCLKGIPINRYYYEKKV